EPDAGRRRVALDRVHCVEPDGDPRDRHAVDDPLRQPGDADRPRGERLRHRQRGVVQRSPIASTFTDATHLGATIPASALQNAGDLPVVVPNPAPGGGVSTPVTVHVVYPSPTATSISPNNIVLGSPPPTVVMTGTGFLAGVTSLAFEGAAAATNVID